MSAVRIVLLVVFLSGLDVTAAVFIKEAALHNEARYLAVGIACMIGVALTLYVCVQAADLTFVSLAWIIAFQAGVMLADRMRFGVKLSLAQFLLVAMAMALLLLAALWPTATRNRSLPWTHFPTSSPLSTLTRSML